MREQEMAERVVALSSKALAEKERGGFISCLQERSALVARILAGGVEVREETLRTWLETERKVLARLEEERRHMLKEMDTLSVRRMAVHQYSSKFPFPPMPVFFDEAG